MKHGKRGLRLLVADAIVILVLVMLYSGLRILESTVLRPQVPRLDTGRKTLTHDGVNYYPRQDVTTVLVMGINRRGTAAPTAYNKGGAADMVALLVFDKARGSFHVLKLPLELFSAPK